jgi:hypothetical protein
MLMLRTKTSVCPTKPKRYQKSFIQICNSDYCREETDTITFPHCVSYKSATVVYSISIVPTTNNMNCRSLSSMDLPSTEGQICQRIIYETTRLKYVLPSSYTALPAFTWILNHILRKSVSIPHSYSPWNGEIRMNEWDRIILSSYSHSSLWNNDLRI